jgi:hypothetical protein
MERKDFCLGCGREYENELWGANCTCDVPNVVHQKACDGCGSIMGYIIDDIDDDYRGPEKLYCPGCLNKSRKEGV